MAEQSAKVLSAVLGASVLSVIVRTTNAGVVPDTLPFMVLETFLVALATLTMYLTFQGDYAA